MTILLLKGTPGKALGICAEERLQRRRVRDGISLRPGFDFTVSFPCGHSDCTGLHSLTIRVIDKCYEALRKKHQVTFGSTYDVPSPALFGNGPKNTFWEMVHGAGGGCESVDDWMTVGYQDFKKLWRLAAHD